MAFVIVVVLNTNCELKEEWNNLKVCSECFEPKAPQIDPRPVITDPEAAYNPRPNNDKELVRDLWLYQMQTILRLHINSLSMNPSILGTNFTTPEMTGSVGTVTITT